MKIENECYILIKKDNEKSVYLTPEYDFSNDICSALKAANKTTALLIIEDFKYEMCKKFNYTYGSYKSGLEIIPLKRTYEW